MMKTILTICSLLCCLVFQAQTKISGKLVDQKGKPQEGVNVFIEGTYDGAPSAADGTFSFETDAKGSQVLVISSLLFETIREAIVIETYKSRSFTVKSSANALNDVVISVGSFQAGGTTKASVLKPLDIVTTAGSPGNIIGALQTLPGAQIVGESGRLFVRGGESDETQTYIDGIRVAQPYGASANNLPTRGRFSPFLFSGMSFTTGGYSAEFGDALSSVLLLNTIDEPDQEKTDISLMTVGLGVGNTQKWGKGSFSFNTSYINLEPYQKAIQQNVDWIKPYQSMSGEMVFRRQFKNGLFKFYTAYDYANFELNQKDINYEDPIHVAIQNNNLYLNASYKGNFGANWTIQTGIGYGYSLTKTDLDSNAVKDQENAAHLKLKLGKKFSNKVRMIFGGDYFTTDFDGSYRQPSNEFKTGYTSGIGALYAETDIVLTSDFAVKAGLRGMHSDLLGTSVLEPRASLAYRTNKNGQLSLAYGDFNQLPKQDYLKYTSAFEPEKTAHYILNYTYNPNGRTLRAELYYKDYSNLVKYNTDLPQYNSIYTNNGSGYAKGFDLFWRDNKTVKNLEYWLSYSYIDSKRDYKNYPDKVTPNFVANHTLSIVGKYWINDLRSQLSVTNSFATGRPYNNPNEMTFMNGKTTSYNSLSLSWAYLMSPQKILYLSVSNVMGKDNVFGYQYANSPDVGGQFQRQAIGQAADRFFFIGFFWTISQDKKSNQLENL